MYKNKKELKDYIKDNYDKAHKSWLKFQGDDKIGMYYSGLEDGYNSALFEIDDLVEYKGVKVDVINTESGDWGIIFVDDKFYAEDHEIRTDVWIELIKEFRVIDGVKEYSIADGIMETLGYEILSNEIKMHLEEV